MPLSTGSRPLAVELGHQLLTRRPTTGQPPELQSFAGESGITGMKKKKLLLMGLAFAAAVFAVGVRGDAAEEVKRLAELMGWKAGTIAADIGAGDGKYTFAAVERVGV